jgi:hypothetical protein
MSYCRFLTDGAYVYADEEGLKCVACRISPDGNGWYETVKFNNHRELYNHLKWHIVYGHNIRACVFKRIREEIARENVTPK